MTHLITPAQLKRLISRGKAPRILDVRWRPIAPNGQADYVSGHLPEAVYVDLETELAFRGARSEGRHPLPPLDLLQSAVRRWGISDEDEVVVYDDNSSISAARAWWVLRHAGLKKVRILDGALAGWRAAGGKLEAGTPFVRPGTATLRYGHLDALETDEIPAVAARRALLDARATEHFHGIADIGEPRGGHIPGALSVPTTFNINEDGTLKDADQLRTRFSALGLDPSTPVAVYCTSGIAAAHEVLALTIAGYRAALYPGSWSAWVNTPIREFLATA
ncbi:sulfurtransferase [Rarobacter incanus]|uniref:Thiosulfate/3-mercaptopyruvate sulfurtransferase n=1 Tax=Rarobacter incanus TaxID=153494 RepID=A0A542SQI4_9MICO|nr:sulfurtransferase [Rarobacter incanus]TQK76862.1 thiosulfate/3-mercaptopyruvate sulfurtransferase [Rarobacter incanus]